MKKYCSGCGLYLQAKAFRKSSKGADGLSVDCLTCQSKRVHILPEGFEQNRKMRRRNMKERRVQPHAIKYGITEADWLQLLNKQGNLCAICGGKQEGRVLCIDHDHLTGKVRGLLCGNCNVGLGNFRDSPKILESAIAYLLEKGGVLKKDGS